MSKKMLNQELTKILSSVYRCMDQLIGIMESGECEVEGYEIETLIFESKETLEQVERVLKKYQYLAYGI